MASPQPGVHHRAVATAVSSAQASSDDELTPVPPPSPPPPRLLNLAAYECEFKRLLPPPTYDYYTGGALDEVTLRYNTRSFEPLVIRPRTLVDVRDIDLVTHLPHPQLTLSLPLLLAPVALQCMAHEEGESGSARGAASAGVPMCVSTTATQSIEQVAAASPATQLLFQLYVYNDHALTSGLVRRAEAAGYRGLVVTVDAPYLGYKWRDVTNDFSVPSRYVVANFPPGPLRSMRKRPIGVGAASVTQKEKAVMGRSSAFSWRDLRALVASTRLPVWVKGVLTAEDAEAACEAGCTGVVVSNHGGRQLDTAPAPVDVVAHISEAVRDWSDSSTAGGEERRRVSVLMDGGVRRGSDVFKALALGADAVLIGRPMLWGLAYGGSGGVQQVIECLRDELRLCMALAGCRTIADIQRRHVRWRSDIQSLL